MVPCSEGCRSRFCYPCLNGSCPYGRDFYTDCYPKLSVEQQYLFDMLIRLRARLCNYLAESAEL